MVAGLAATMTLSSSLSSATVRRWGHGSDKKLRELWGERFGDQGVDIVLAGHDHFYQKIRPQVGVHYFVSGGAGKVRNGVKEKHPEVEFAAESYHFLRFEVSVDEVKYVAIDDSGDVLHQGRITKSSTR